ncbi:hypothetical protein [Pedobacter sp. JY14-1]|uniref:hypothetical protein n=1 Tax=Pedobacter sp. JY14-1 TaxID=3034151 RepID=UPI0023E30E49|nr:hypothetical protein [Pedobacter sp. JY14-1]
MGIEEQLLDLAKKEGKQEEKIQTALEMKKNHFSDEVIATITKLTLEEIKKL